VDLLGEAEHAWKRTVQKKTWLSPLHKAVSLTLWRLGIVHHDNQITPDSMFCVDILLEGTNVRPWAAPKLSRSLHAAISKEGGPFFILRQEGLQVLRQ